MIITQCYKYFLVICSTTTLTPSGKVETVPTLQNEHFVSISVNSFKVCTNRDSTKFYISPMTNQQVKLPTHIHTDLLYPISHLLQNFSSFSSLPQLPYCNVLTDSRGNLTAKFLVREFIPRYISVTDAFM